METLKTRLASYIAGHRHKSYQWGQLDCNLFISRWMDQEYGLNTTSEIQGKYSDKISAIRFARKMDAQVYMVDCGFMPDLKKPRTGDVILQKEQGFFCAWLVLNHLAYSVHKDHNLVAVPVDTLDWQHNTWKYYD